MGLLADPNNIRLERSDDFVFVKKVCELVIGSIPF